MKNISTLPQPASLPGRVAVPCPLCEADVPRTVYQSEEPFQQIVRCARCGFLYQNPRLAETDLPDAYELFEGYQRFPEQDSAKRALFQARIRRFEREWQLPPDGCFLDFGAARGIMLDCVRSRLPGWTLHGVELSVRARAALRERGYHAAASLRDLDPQQKFDWINIDNVLEHLPEPVETLRALRSRLKPGGRIYIEVPNESFLPLRYRINDFVRGFRKLPTAEGHINLFTARTLRRLLSSAGMRPQRFWLESVSVPHRLKAALGGDETPRVQTALQLLRISRLDVILRAAYFICTVVREPAV